MALEIIGRRIFFDFFWRKKEAKKIPAFCGYIEKEKEKSRKRGTREPVRPTTYEKRKAKLRQKEYESLEEARDARTGSTKYVD